MRKYLLAAILVTVFTAPTFAAEQFYLAYDGKRCEVFSHKPPAGMNVLGTYDFAARRPKGEGQEGSMQVKDDWCAVGVGSVGALLVLSFLPPERTRGWLFFGKSGDAYSS